MCIFDLMLSRLIKFVTKLIHVLEWISLTKMELFSWVGKIFSSKKHAAAFAAKCVESTNSIFVKYFKNHKSFSYGKGLGLLIKKEFWLKSQNATKLTASS